MKKKILQLTVFSLLIWFGIEFYQIKISHVRCHEMGFLRGRLESIPCYEEQQKIAEDNFQEVIRWPFENSKAVFLYLWNLGI